MACSKYSDNGDHSPDLCDDLLVEILTKLPLKSLFRSKLVSKTWLRLISSDRRIQRKLPFIISGIYCHGHGTSFRHRYACMHDAKFADCNLGFFPFHPGSRILDCCNGLLLFYSPSSRTLNACNPTTKRWSALPRSNKPSLLSVLAFDPFHSPYYKVICFTGWQTHGAKLDVFSSETGRWVELDVKWGVESVTMSSTMSYFNGVLYILSNTNCIVCIELDTMRTRRVELPEPAKIGAHVGKNGGYLCYYAGIDGSESRVWMLRDFDSCRWELKHCMSLKAPTESRFLSFHPELDLIYFMEEGKIVSYDMSKNRIEHVGCFEMGRDREYLVQIWVFQFSNYMSDCLLKEQT